jgi:hypothetical protein
MRSFILLTVLIGGCLQYSPPIVVSSNGQQPIVVAPVQQEQRSENGLTQSVRPGISHGVILSPQDKAEMARKSNQLEHQLKE